ncbi:hypothetical protein G6O67_005473 [Ophiocordyceps sinensis]|uniref:NAD(P)-binding domain protein n=2 Tax=Ophiocordyceps sinensis TaxID=72228 RepID=A0A8H4PRI2_9HYPO|nr:NAD(P)-binding domain protein [Ophiocordyceps sinensis CO18]KAF4509185.1 hypothetical protein G6O67_005473 [Ophiocordyceps sinensis]
MAMPDRKVVLVTGANTGLGFEIIRALCGSDTSLELLLGGRSLQKAQAAVDDAVAEFPSVKGRISAIQIDVEDDSSIESAVQRVKTKYGRLDALVNNAGAQFDPLLGDGTMTMRQVWNQSWNVNTAASWLREWHRVLKNDGVKVWCISPGYLATGLGGSQEKNKKQGACDAALGGEFVKNVLEGKRDGHVGKVILRDGVQPW